ncbi:hypothetical protein D3C76_1374330 [compost metagenome]
MIKMAFRGLIDFGAQGREIVILAGARPINGEAGPMTKLHENKQYGSAITVQKGMGISQQSKYLTRVLPQPLLILP